ncbi:hypothetical protein [Paenibacillus kobensis]|uniref:hypothetical protein n=1 Tax=Paenibacillus kobensis TaxID=59841 RepID=UPI000FDC48FE|nr:hypothetical protein [Paenibacillus kobensis]
MALTEDVVIDSEPSSEDIAVWAAVLVVAADVLALIALLKARNEKNTTLPAEPATNSRRHRIKRTKPS